jgi:quercetin dioxygenase-like cupin family protein
MTKQFLVATILAVPALSLVQPISAQDPAVVNAKTVRVNLENDQVRVLEATLQPGDKEQVHSHPAYVTYVVTGGKVRNHAADGKVTESELVTGDTLYRDPLTHWAENIGTTTIHVILVELKSPPHEQAPH